MARYMPRHAKNTHSKFKTVLSVLIVAFLICAITMSAFVSAKYMSQKQTDKVIAAKSFYFESDLLTEDCPTYTLTPGTNEITVRLKNYADSLRFSEVPISYKLTATNQNAITDSLVENKTDYNDNTFSNLTPGTYTVTATVTSPYSKTLSAVFVIPEKEISVGQSLSDAQGSPVLRLTVWTNDYEGKVTLSWPDTIYPDNTDPLLKDVFGASVEIEFGKDSSYTFVFFKSNPDETYQSVLNENNTTVTIY